MRSSGESAESGMLSRVASARTQYWSRACCDAASTRGNWPLPTSSRGLSLRPSSRWRHVHSAVYSARSLASADVVSRGADTCATARDAGATPISVRHNDHQGIRDVVDMLHRPEDFRPEPCGRDSRSPRYATAHGTSAGIPLTPGRTRTGECRPGDGPRGQQMRPVLAIRVDGRVPRSGRLTRRPDADWPAPRGIRTANTDFADFADFSGSTARAGRSLLGKSEKSAKSVFVVPGGASIASAEIDASRGVPKERKPCPA